MIITIIFKQGLFYYNYSQTRPLALGMWTVTFTANVGSNWSNLKYHTAYCAYWRSAVFLEYALSKLLQALGEYPDFEKNMDFDPFSAVSSLLSEEWKSEFLILLFSVCQPVNSEVNFLHVAYVSAGLLIHSG